MIKVGEIKKIINDLPDDMEVKAEKDDIIVSIMLRLAELDFEIFDVKKQYIEKMDEINSPDLDYIYEKFLSLREEYRILKNIMSDYYNDTEIGDK